MRLSAVEAALWADTPANESALNVWRQGVDAACQADLDARPVTCDDPVDPAPFAHVAGSSGEPLAEQGSADFYGSPFAFNLRSGRMHLVVPRGLQVRADRPRAFCGGAFWETPESWKPASRFPEDPEAICDKCFPKLKAFTTRRLLRAAAEAQAALETGALDA